MQCGCPECGILMSLEQRGVESQCRCPGCLYACDACLGTKSVLSPQEIRRTYERNLMMREHDRIDEHTTS